MDKHTVDRTIEACFMEADALFKQGAKSVLERLILYEKAGNAVEPTRLSLINRVMWSTYKSLELKRT